MRTLFLILTIFVWTIFVQTIQAQQTLANGKISLNVSDDVSIVNGSLDIPSGKYFTQNSVKLLFIPSSSTTSICLANSGNLTFTGASNMTLGTQAGNGLTTGTENSLYGYRAGYRLQDANYCMAIGSQALQADISGVNNTAVGYGALYATTLGYNTGVGSVALYNNSTGIYNVGIGHYCGRYKTTGDNNTMIGSWAGYGQNGLSTYSFNTMLGYVSGYTLTTGSYNTLLGYATGYSVTSGNQNVFVGDSAGYSASQLATAINSIAIGSQTYTSKNYQIQFGNTTINEYKLSDMQFIVTKTINNTAKDSLSTSVSGLGKIIIGNNQEFAIFGFKEDGTVNLILNSANITTTMGTASSLNIYKSALANKVVIENKLGSNLSCHMVIDYNK